MFCSVGVYVIDNTRMFQSYFFKEIGEGEEYA